MDYRNKEVNKTTISMSIIYGNRQSKDINSCSISKRVNHDQKYDVCFMNVRKKKHKKEETSVR